MNLIAKYFGNDKSRTDIGLTALKDKLKEIPGLMAASNGRIFAAVGGLDIEDSSAPFSVYVLPVGESEDTTPGGNSRITMDYAIVLVIEVSDFVHKDEDPSVLTVVDIIKGFLLSKNNPVLDANGAPVFSRITEFKQLSYDSFQTEESGPVMMVLPIILTAQINVHSQSRNALPATT